MVAFFKLHFNPFTHWQYKAISKLPHILTYVTFKCIKDAIFNAGSLASFWGGKTISLKRHKIKLLQPLTTSTILPLSG